MNAIFYTSTANPLQVDKTSFLTQLSSMTITPNANLDVENPSVVVTYNSTLMNCNYIKLDDYYYFVDDPILVTGHQMTFNLTKDVLMSNKAGIMNCKCIAARTGTDRENYSSYIHDDRQWYYTYKTICTRLINTFQYSDSVILITAG